MITLISKSWKRFTLNLTDKRNVYIRLMHKKSEDRVDKICQRLKNQRCQGTTFVRLKFGGASPKDSYISKIPMGL